MMIYKCINSFQPNVGRDMYGQWATDQRKFEKGKAFEIPMNGLGVFSCRD